MIKNKKIIVVGVTANILFEKNPIEYTIIREISSNLKK